MPDVTKERTPRWWEEPQKPGMTPQAITVVNTLISANGQLRRLSLLQWYRLYNNVQARGLLAGNYFRPQIQGRQNRLTLNIVKSAVDTMVSRITKNEPKPTFLTNGGTWSDQKKAKLLDDFCQGIFYQTHLPETAEDIFRDACIFGTAAAKVFEDDEGKVSIERVFTEELIVDDIEAVYGKPRSMFQVRMVSRDVLLAMEDFQGKDEQKIIREAPTAKVDAQLQAFADQSDLVMVVEGWHLPSAKPKALDAGKVRDLRKRIADETNEDGDRTAARNELAELMKAGHDGRHGMFLESGTLLFEGWRKRQFPFVLTHYTKPVRGFLNGSGIPEELVGIQYEINKILIMMSECLYWCVPKLLIDAAAKVVQAHLDDIAGGVIKYHGGPNNRPQLVAWNAIPEALFQQLDRLIRQAYEIIGISQMSAQSKKPAGLESGAALREYADIETERFTRQGKSYERFYLDCAALAIRQAREIAERNGGEYPVNVPKRRRMWKRVDWSEIDLEDDAFIMQCFPTSALPRTPAGRLQMVSDLMTLGFLDKEDAIRLLNYPDLDAVEAVMEAAAEFTNWQIEQMVEKGKPQIPQPYQNLAYTLTHAQSAFLTLQTMGLEEGRLELLRGYIEQVKALAMKATQPPPAPGAQPGIPAGPPGPPPFGVPGSAPPPAPTTPPAAGAPPAA